MAHRRRSHPRRRTRCYAEDPRSSHAANRYYVLQRHDSHRRSARALRGQTQSPRRLLPHRLRRHSSRRVHHPASHHRPHVLQRSRAKGRRQSPVAPQADGHQTRGSQQNQHPPHRSSDHRPAQGFPPRPHRKTLPHPTHSLSNSAPKPIAPPPPSPNLLQHSGTSPYTPGSSRTPESCRTAN